MHVRGRAVQEIKKTLLTSDKYLKINSWINIKKQIFIIDTPNFGLLDIETNILKICPGKEMIWLKLWSPLVNHCMKYKICHEKTVYNTLQS